MKQVSLTKFALLSIVAAVLTIGLKVGAYLITDSVGLLSDALESGVNLVGALMALAMLTVASRPADEEHAYGHSKAEYFSSGVEGTLILVAAIGIGVAAVERLINPRPLEQIGAGLAVSVVAAFVNLAVALLLLGTAKRYESITLKANAYHLLTDVWTSVGVVVGVGAVAWTGLGVIDSVVALIVAGNICWSGFRIIRDSVRGLMDTALPAHERDLIQKTLEPYKQAGIGFHEMLTRQSGTRRFVSLHVLVPGDWTVHRGHQQLEQIEADIRAALPSIAVFTHLESFEDPSSWDDGTAGESEVKRTKRGV